MPTLIRSFAPQTRVAAAAVAAPRKNLRDVRSDILMRILSSAPENPCVSMGKLLK